MSCSKTFPLITGLAVLLLSSAVPARSQNEGPKVSLGAGLRTGYVHSKAASSASTDEVQFNSARIYINGSATENIKFMFNTEYDGTTNKIGVLDAVGRLEMSPKFNVWAGRFLPPTDRANLYGPYYASQWGVYTDGIQDGYPFVFQGRDNGVAYWGDFSKVKVSVGAFDGKSATGNAKILGAGRVQIDLWDKEDGYYLNGTYYGAKKLLAIGGATQLQSGKTATTLDFLMERQIPNAGVVTIESEYANYNGLGGYDGRYAKSEGAYALAAYLFPKKVGVGKIQVLGKYAIAEFSHGLSSNYRQKTTEVNVNYLIKEFNARVMTFFRDTRFVGTQPKSYQFGVGLQLQM